MEVKRASEEESCRVLRKRERRRKCSFCVEVKQRRVKSALEKKMKQASKPEVETDDQLSRSYLFYKADFS